MKQIAALCWRPAKVDGGKEVLLVTSRGTGRWILPKGWPIRGTSDRNAALTEAWEEAGVRKAEVSRKPIGRYWGVKQLKSGLDLPVTVHVYAAKVRKIDDDHPEAGERTRLWTHPREAAEMVLEPGLALLLRRF